MYIRDISLVNFRNYYQLQLQLTKGINIFDGDSPKAERYQKFFSYIKSFMEES